MHRTVLVLMAVVIPLSAGFLPATAIKPFRMSLRSVYGRVDLNAGERVFAAKCGHCHAIRPDAPSGTGPNLASIGKDAAGRKPGLSAAQYILESILSPTTFVAPGATAIMPRSVPESLKEEDVRNLVGFLASRDATPDFSEINALRFEMPQPSTGLEHRVDLSQIEAGERLYREKAGCIRCHDLEQRASFRTRKAPSLDIAAVQDHAYLRESILNPSAKISATYGMWSVAMADGQILTGQLIDRSKTDLKLLTFDEKGRPHLRQIPLSDVEVGDDGKPMVRETGVSPMPDGFGESLSREEIECLLAFIKHLK